VLLAAIVWKFLLLREVLGGQGFWVLSFRLGGLGVFVESLQGITAEVGELCRTNWRGSRGDT